MITRIPFNGKFRVTGAYWQTSGYWSPSKPHTGIDLVGDDNRSVYSTTVGTVALAGAMGNGWGKCVYINDDTYTHLFAHLDSIDVLVGDKVTYTTKLGVMGSTGNVTGAHTHYELRKYSNEGKHRDINTGTRYSIYDVAEYMGIPNEKGVYNSNDFAINESQDEPPIDNPPADNPPQLAYKIGDTVRVSSCYPSANAPLGFPPNGKAMTPAKGCDTGRIIKIFEGTNNPYQVEDWYFVNDGDIRTDNEPSTPPPVVVEYQYKVGQLVTYSTAYKDANGVKASDINPHQRHYITKIIDGARNPYRLGNGWYLNDGDIREINN